MTTATASPVTIRCERCRRRIRIGHRNIANIARRFCAKCAREYARERSRSGGRYMGAWLSAGEKRKLHEGF